MTTRQNTDYGYDIQKLYLEMMLSDAGTFVRCQSIFDSTLFDKKLQDAAEFLNNYVTEHNALPTYDMIRAATKTELKDPGMMKDEHYDWLMAEFETFTRHKGLERAILKAADMLDEGNYGPVEDMIKQAVQVGLQKDMGTDYWADPKGRLVGLKDKNGQVKTGWDTVDRRLFGGFNRGELNIFAGGSGAGKSLFLANLGVNFALQGLNVVYLTLELSEPLVGMRVDSMTTGISTKEIFKDLDNLDMQVRMIGKKAGAFQIKYMPSGKTCNDIRSYMKEFEIKTEKKIDILLVDYMDLLMPLSKKISAENLFVKDKYVSEEMRNLAMEKNVVCVTAAQLNRGAVEEVEFDHSHISGGLSKIQTADNVFGIFTSRAMRERGKYQIQLMKTRSSSGVGMKIDLEFDIDSLRITDAGEEGQGNDDYRPKSSAILDSIKRQGAQPQGGISTTVDPDTGEVKHDPTMGIAIPKVRAQADSTKLRQFLNNLNEDSEI
jgi:archaellum biogenesis ATPase FlaH